MAILGIVALIAIPGFLRGRSNQELRQAADVLASDLRLAVKQVGQAKLPMGALANLSDYGGSGHGPQVSMPPEVMQGSAHRYRVLLNNDGAWRELRVGSIGEGVQVDVQGPSVDEGLARQAAILVSFGADGVLAIGQNGVPAGPATFVLKNDSKTVMVAMSSNGVVQITEN